MNSTGKSRLGWLSGAAWLFMWLAAAPCAMAANGLATVKDYGAVGDGVTNDAPAFSSAFASNKVVYVPPGRYRVAAQVRVPAGGALIGPGTLYVDWNPATAGNAQSGAAVLLNGNGARIEGVRIEKNFTDGSYGTGILADRRVDVVIRRVEISGYSARYGIHLIECTDFNVSQCLVRDFMMNTTADMIQDSPAGIRITRSIRGVLSENIVRNIEVGPLGLVSVSPLVPAYGAQGYQSDCITLMQCRDMTVLDNECETSGEGIDALLSESCTFNGNVVRDQYALGFKLIGSAFNTVAGNYISDCYIGIVLDNSYSDTRAYGNAIMSNVFRDIGSPGSFGVPGPGRVPLGNVYGIYVDGSSNYNNIAENVFLDSQATKTMVAAVYPSPRFNNRITENVISTQLTYPQTPAFDPNPPVETGARQSWWLLE